MRATIIGAGVAGLTTALALQSTGVEVEVFEARAAPVPGQAGPSMLSPNASRVLRALRVLDTLTPSGIEPHWLHQRSARSGYVISWRTLGELFRARYGAPWLMVDHDELRATLGAAATDRGVVIHHDTPVDASLAVASELVVCADGEDSGMARALGLAGECHPTGWRLWQGYIEAAAAPTGMPATANAITQWLGPAHQLLTAPCTDGRWYWQALTHGEGELNALFRDWHGIAAELLAAAEPGEPRPVFDRALASSFNVGKHALVGAAAHPLPAHLDQGEALAIEDAWVLAHLVADHDDDVPAGLAEYHRHRRGRAQRMQDHARALATNSAAAGRAQRLRSRALRAVTCRLLPEMDVERDDWIYGYDAVRHYG